MAAKKRAAREQSRDPAFDRLVRALNGLGAAALVRKAFAAEAVLSRFAPVPRGDRAPAPEQTITGQDAIARWLAQTPPGTTFLLDPKAAKGAGLSCAYLIRHGDFENGGTWTLTLADDGRIATLEHRPWSLA
ncbi:MAG: hypothetical protein JST92_18435 [Deltaproteobacteria bacterium]|nr:hypothetical protein [Deltaproteobacteria bacterium]